MVAKLKLKGIDGRLPPGMEFAAFLGESHLYRLVLAGPLYLALVLLLPFLRR